MTLITTNEATCRDCYKCIRSCPVKAISIKANEHSAEVHARVIDERCVHDGRCVLVCPQKAKKVREDTGAIKKLLSRGAPVAASVAPSFAAALPLPEPGLMPAALKKLGFHLVQETAVGAELVAGEHRRTQPPGPVISSACPVIVNLVERHYPDLIQYLSPLVSPMVAHARLLKMRHPGMKVVFIGPCIAKIGEASFPGIEDAVDFAIGFKGLWEWLLEEEIDLATLPPSGFDGRRPGVARLFPLEGGQLRASSMSTDLLDTGVLAVTGLEKCMGLLDHLLEGYENNKRPQLIELLACGDGCIGGPLAVSEQDIFIRRQKVMDYYAARRKEEKNSEHDFPEVVLPSPLLYRQYQNRKVSPPRPDEEAVKSILAQTGKFQPEDELNCGACGYGSCREKATAVYYGNAELQMCIPYMRKRAESMSNLVIRSMPNGVVIVDNSLIILEVNPAAERMFKSPAARVIGRPLETLIDPANFKRAIEEKKLLEVETSYTSYGAITRQIIFPLEREKIAVGILVDITEDRRQKEQLDQVKTQTIRRAQEVIDKQMTVAQEIAGLLGETTAETKVLLGRLIQLMQEQ